MYPESKSTSNLFKQRSTCYRVKNYAISNPNVNDSPRLLKQLGRTASCNLYAHDNAMVYGKATDGNRDDIKTGGMTSCDSMICPHCFNKASAKQKAWINAYDHAVSKPEIHPATGDIMRVEKRAIMITLSIGSMLETLRRDLSLETLSTHLAAVFKVALGRKASAVNAELRHLNGDAEFNAPYFMTNEILCGFSTGWHTHLHIVVWVDAAADVSKLQKIVTRTHNNYMRKNGFRISGDNSGSFVSDAVTADYGCKDSSGWTIGDEASGQGGKQSGSMTINQLIEVGFNGAGNYNDKQRAFCKLRALEYIETMYGKHIFTRSKGLSESYLHDLVTEQKLDLEMEAVESGEALDDKPTTELTPIASLNQKETKNTISSNEDNWQAMKNGWVNGGKAGFQEVLLHQLIIADCVSDEVSDVDKWLDNQERLLNPVEEVNTLDTDDVNHIQDFIQGSYWKTSQSYDKATIEQSRTEYVTAEFKAAREAYTPPPPIDDTELQTIAERKYD